MENTLKEKLRLGSCLNICGETALIEGNAKVNGSEPASILECYAMPEVISVSAGNASAGIEGKVRFSIIYLGKSGEVESFEPECSFVCDVENEAIESSMNILASAELLECSAKIVERNSPSELYMTALISVNLDCISNRELTAVTESSTEGFETLLSTAELPEIVTSKNVKLYINEETAEIPSFYKLLSVRAFAVPSKLTKESGRLIFEGDIHVSVLYLSEESRSEPKFREFAVPFGEIVTEDLLTTEESSVYYDMHVERVGMSADFELSCVISLNYLISEYHEKSFVSDLYMAKRNGICKTCEVKKSKLSYVMPSELETRKRIIRLSMEIPDSYPAVSRVISALGTVQTVSVENVCKNGVSSLSVSAVLCVNLCYSTADTGIRSIRSSIPFETELDLSADSVRISPFVEYIEAEGASNEIELKAGIEFIVHEEKSLDMDILTGFEMGEELAGNASTLSIYYPGKGETLWDIAKKFKSPVDKILIENGFAGIDDIPGKWVIV